MAEAGASSWVNTMSSCREAMGIKIACALKYATGRGQGGRGSGQIAERALACQQLEMEGTDAPWRRPVEGGQQRAAEQEQEGEEGTGAFDICFPSS